MATPVLSGLALGVCMLASSTAFAGRHAAESIDTFYYDANGVVVGEYNQTCFGRPIQWGITTSDARTVVLPCDPPNHDGGNGGGGGGCIPHQAPWCIMGLKGN